MLRRMKAVTVCDKRASLQQTVFVVLAQEFSFGRNGPSVSDIDGLYCFLCLTMLICRTLMWRWNFCPTNICPKNFYSNKICSNISCFDVRTIFVPIFLRKNLLMHQWSSTFLTFSFIIGGTSKKVLQFLMIMESIYNKNDHSNKQNVNYKHCHKV